MEKTKKCSKCGSEIEEGHLNYHGMKWVKGDPNLITKIDASGASGQTVKAYRCLKCGFIEFYTEGYI